METTPAFQFVKKTLSDKKINTSKLALENHLQNDLGLDDLDTVELVMEIERKLKKEIKDEDIARWSTVGDVVNTVQQFLA